MYNSTIVRKICEVARSQEKEKKERCFQQNFTKLNPIGRDLA